MGEISDVFERKYEYQYEKTLDVERMKEAASYLIEHMILLHFAEIRK